MMNNQSISFLFFKRYLIKQHKQEYQHALINTRQKRITAWAWFRINEQIFCVRIPVDPSSAVSGGISLPLWTDKQNLQDFYHPVPFVYPSTVLFVVFFFCFFPPNINVLAHLQYCDCKKICRGCPSVWLYHHVGLLIFCLANEAPELPSPLQCDNLPSQQCVQLFALLHLFPCAFPMKPSAPLTVKYLRDVTKRSEHIPAHSLSIPLRLLCSTLLPLWFTCFPSPLL